MRRQTQKMKVEHTLKLPEEIRVPRLALYYENRGYDLLLPISTLRSYAYDNEDTCPYFGS